MTRKQSLGVIALTVIGLLFTVWELIDQSKSPIKIPPPGLDVLVGFIFFFGIFAMLILNRNDGADKLFDFLVWLLAGGFITGLGGFKGPANVASYLIKGLIDLLAGVPAVDGSSNPPGMIIIILTILLVYILAEGPGWDAAPIVGIVLALLFGVLFFFLSGGGSGPVKTFLAPLSSKISQLDTATIYLVFGIPLTLFANKGSILERAIDALQWVIIGVFTTAAFGVAEPGDMVQSFVVKFISPTSIPTMGNFGPFTIIFLVLLGDLLLAFSRGLGRNHGH